MKCVGLRGFGSQLLNVHGVSDVRQIEVHTAEPLVLILFLLRLNLLLKS
jgi:hypothetical protein